MSRITATSVLSSATTRITLSITTARRVGFKPPLRAHWPLIGSGGTPKIYHLTFSSSSQVNAAAVVVLSRLQNLSRPDTALNAPNSSVYKNMKFSFTISPTNRPSFTRVSDDRTFEEALITAKMLEECFPGARVEVNHRKKLTS